VSLSLLGLPPLLDSGDFRIVVESPRGSRVKLKVDPDFGVVTVSRPLPLGLAYPFDWGFVPGTCAADGDPLDAMVYWDVASFPGIVIACRALGMLKVEQDSKGRPGRRERNDRVIGIPASAPRQGELNALEDLPGRVRDELEKFFLDVTAFERKNAVILGWEGAEAAEALIRSSVRTPAAKEFSSAG
jgi:inorganic pyrophosphatase